MDSSTRTKVRMQVMKNYHKKRLEEAGNVSAPVVDAHPKPALSAKSQTHKFRLGEERILRPWKPVKARLKKGKKSAIPQANPLDNIEVQYYVGGGLTLFSNPNISQNASI